MLNHITLQGRLTKNPELRRTSTGLPVASFTLAVDRDFDKTKTDFVDCAAWRNTAEFIEKYFEKGQLMIASGKLQSREWSDKNGNNRVAWEVVVDNAYFGDRKRESNNQTYDAQPEFTEITEDSGDLPF